MPPPLRVLIDARMLIGRFSGVARMVTSLVDQFVRRDDLKVVALCGDLPYAPWRGRTDLEIVTTDFSRSDRTPPRRWVWEERKLRGFIEKANVDVYHATWNSGIPSGCPVPAVLTLHDLIAWDQPRHGLADHWDGWCYRRGLRGSARRATHVVTVSDFVRGQVLDRLRLDPARVSTVYNGVDHPRNAPASRSTPAMPYVLYVGGHEPRKNLAALFAAVRSYWEQFGLTLELRLTGRTVTLPADAAAEYLRLPVNVPVRFLGDVDDGELSRQYASASALLLLSETEGFGLPVVEAMAHGCPVVASARTALLEVVGDAGILVDPRDPRQVANAVYSVVTSAEYRSALSERGRVRAAAFSWERTAQQLADVYHQIGRTPRLRTKDASGPVSRVLTQGSGATHHDTESQAGSRTISVGSSVPVP